MLPAFSLSFLLALGFESRLFTVSCIPSLLFTFHLRQSVSESVRCPDWPELVILLPWSPRVLGLFTGHQAQLLFKKLNPGRKRICTQEHCSSRRTRYGAWRVQKGRAPGRLEDLGSVCVMRLVASQYSKAIWAWDNRAGPREKHCMHASCQWLLGEGQRAWHRPSLVSNCCQVQWHI